MTILLVALGNSDGEKLRVQLRTLGHEVELSNNPAWPLNGHRLTLVLVAGDTAAAVAAIREVRSFQEGRLPVLSCGARGIDVKALVEAGADDYQAYPCETAELEARLRVIEARWNRPGARDGWQRFEDRLMQAHSCEVLAGLVGRIAHDYNNLLAAVQGNADLCLLNAGVGASIRYGLEQIRMAAGKAVDLTRQLQVFKKARAGQVTPMPLDLSALVRDSGDLMRVAVSRKCQLRYDLADAGVVVSGDAGRLKQMLVAMAINASEAMGEDGGEVVVRTKAGGGCVVLEVEDSGPGVEPAVRGRIFDPFFTTKEPGRGLGLAAVQAIARAHGARIETEGGAGALFRVVLPVSMENGSAETTRSAEGTALQGTVLLVDSDDILRTEARRQLRRAGFAVFEAATRAEAFEVMGQVRAGLDAVVLSVDGPAAIDGELVATIGRLQPGLRVVVWSAEFEGNVQAWLPGVRDAAFVDRRAGAGELAQALERVLVR